MDPQLLIVLTILGITVALIVTEVFRIDVVAILAMLALAWAGSITPEQARSGFSSNAVLAIIAVMVMGRGLYKSGITEQIANLILQIAGSGRRRIISTVSVTVGLMSGFMQNIGAAALFLPVMTGISKREKISISSLLVPMGFAALLGGAPTIVGTSSLIALNDLLTACGIEPSGRHRMLRSFSSSVEHCFLADPRVGHQSSCASHRETLGGETGYLESVAHRWYRWPSRSLMTAELLPIPTSSS